MIENDHSWDKFLQIKTSGRDDTNADQFHYPYEPTSYTVLDRLATSGLIQKGDTILDYGCGKGRVGFFLSYRTKANSIGIEYDERIYQSALKNQKTAISRNRTDFILADARNYEVPAEVNRCYFFNPFSVDILHQVISRIIESYYANPREIFLFFYYPSDAYISYLMGVNELDFYDAIECDDLFKENSQQERIMIFQLSGNF